MVDHLLERYATDSDGADKIDAQHFTAGLLYQFAHHSKTYSSDLQDEATEGFTWSFQGKPLPRLTEAPQTPQWGPILGRHGLSYTTDL